MTLTGGGAAGRESLGCFERHHPPGPTTSFPHPHSTASRTVSQQFLILFFVAVRARNIIESVSLVSIGTIILAQRDPPASGGTR